MITPARIRVAIVMMRRASCTGDEAKNVAAAIDAFEALYEQITAASKSADKAARLLEDEFDCKIPDEEEKDGNYA